MYKAFEALKVSVVLILGIAIFGAQATRGKTTPTPTSGKGIAVLWREPVDVVSRDLFYGPGGKAHEPHGPFTFDREITDGSSPKFDVVDQNGVKWRVKMGIEARPETVASRLVWAVGYFANEDYFMPVLHIQGMKHLSRGQHLVSGGDTVKNVRLKRHLKNEKKIGTWSWAADPFKDTREWYGLRVLMAVINNWDLKDQNNSVYQTVGENPEQRYMVSDLGASFGTTGLDRTSKGSLKAYRNSKLIKNVSPGFVDFHVPSLPSMGFFFDVPEFGRRVGLLWLGRHIPTTDAIWLGHLLAQLSPNQIRDAFRAAGYAPPDVEAFSREVEHRIQELESLSKG